MAAQGRQGASWLARLAPRLLRPATSASTGVAALAPFGATVGVGAHAGAPSVLGDASWLRAVACYGHRAFSSRNIEIWKRDRYHTKRAPLTSEYTSLGHIKRRRTAIYDPGYWKVLKAQKPERVPVELPALEPRAWGEESKRTGVLAVKVGMTQEWDANGVRVPLTVLWVDSCHVVQVKTEENEGYNALQLGVGSKRRKQLRATQAGHFERAGLDLKRKVKEFKVSRDALLPVGTELNASHFTAGQYVDVQGTTIGKGFQGVMKRWGFSGGPASHGSSKFHRGGGSTGACQDPGKTWKGTKMAGNMGNKKRTVLSALVYKVDPERNLIFIKGQVPGHAGNFVAVKDPQRVALDHAAVPFPTAILPEEQQWADLTIQVAVPEKNPFDAYNIE